MMCERTSSRSSNFLSKGFSKNCQRLLIIAASFGLAAGVFFNKMQTRTLCINSATPAVQSMCVQCDASKFQQTSMICTGQNAIPANTTAQQAFCLLTNCLQQVRQQGQIVGRRKRSPEPLDETEVSVTNLADDQLEDQIREIF